MNRTGLLIALGLSLVTGIVFGFYPELDLRIAALFYDATAKGFPYSRSTLLEFLRNAAMVVAWAFVAPSILAIIVKLIWPNRALFIPGRKALYLVVTMTLAAGIITNLGFKSYWGRPRPVAVTEFNGQWQFKPFWDSSGECPKNCSFFSGEGATAFWTYAPASLAPPQWRPLAYTAATIFGVVTGGMRVMFGGHFLTDVIISGLVTFLVIWLFHGLIFRWPRTKLTDEGIDAALTRLTWPGYAWRQRVFGHRRPVKPPLADRIIGTHHDD
jgi:lipid A 4'-phosphatase